MSNQPTGKWTKENMAGKWSRGEAWIIDAHNAAIAVEREAHKLNLDVVADALVKAAETFDDLKVGLRLLGKSDVAKACQIAEEYSRDALNKIGLNEQLVAERENIGITCTLSGPGRGDCEHFIGYPSPIHIPNQHDGPDDTVDAYGKPNGWCWTCWKSRQLEQLREQIDAATKEAVVIKALTIELTQQLAAERLRVKDEVWSHEQTVKAFQKQADELRKQLAAEREKVKQLEQQLSRHP